MVVVLLFCSGCLAINARVGAGPAVETDGEVGFQISAGLGFGYAKKESGFVGRSGFGSSDRAGAEATSELSYVRVDEPLVKSVGFGGVVVTTGEGGSLWLSASALRPFSYNRRYSPGHEKIGISTRSRRAFSLGLEGRAGLVLGREVETRGRFAALAVIDYTLLSVMSL